MISQIGLRNFYIYKCLQSSCQAFVGSAGGAVFSDLFAELCTTDFSKQIDDVFKRGGHKRFGTLVLAQNLDAGFVTDARHFEPFDFEILFALAALVRNGKSVRFVASILQKL